MAENQNDKELDALLEDIALEPDTSNISDKNRDTIDIDSNADLDGFLTEIDNQGDSTETPPPDDDPLEEFSLDDAEELTTEEEPENIIQDESGFEADDLEFDDEKEYAVQKKQTKLQKILIGVVIGLIVLIAIGLILYLSGVFDPEEEKVQPTVQKVEEKKAKYKFKQKDINVERLNEKLNMLTKYEILESDEKELEKAMERERLFQEEKARLAAEKQAKIDKIKAIEAKKYEEQLKAQERENALVEKAKLEALKDARKAQEDALAKKMALDAQIEKEEAMKEEEQRKKMMAQNEETQTQTSDEVEMDNKMASNKEVTTVIEETPVTKPEIQDEIVEIKEETIEMPKNKMFVKFIVISTNKRDIYKSYLDKVLTISNDIKLCRNDQNRVEVFVGPFEDEARLDILEQFKEAFKSENPEAIDFTQEEFNKRCNY